MSILSTAFVAVALMAAPVYAQSNWATLGHPLIARDDGIAQGKAYGYYAIHHTENGTRSHAHARLLDPRPGGDGVYGEMETWTNSGICFAPEYTSCTASYYKYAEDQSIRWYDNTWSPYRTTYMATGLKGSADYARGRIKVCEDQRWSSDPCSGWGYSYGEKY